MAEICLSDFEHGLPGGRYVLALSSFILSSLLAVFMGPLKYKRNQCQNQSRCGITNESYCLSGSLG